MTSIVLPDGTIVARTDPRAVRFFAQRERRARNNKYMPLFILLAVVFGPYSLTFLRPGAWTDDLREGHVPASDRAPSEHWGRLRAADFAREYTRNANKDSFAWMRAPGVSDAAEGRRSARSRGHEAEDIDPSEMRGIAATRCASTNYAVTAYYCGDKIASNMDTITSGALSFDV